LDWLSYVWLEFRIGKHYHIISVLEIVSSLSRKKSSALPFFHTLTGCDNTPAFAGRGKSLHGIYIWNTFFFLSEITYTFSALPNSECILTDDMLEKIQQYVVLHYSKTSKAKKANEAR